jgi:pimeloyl-ACP methyl ester carboxylesterase
MDQPASSLLQNGARVLEVAVLGGLAVLGSLAIKNAYEADAAERRTPPKGRFVSVGGIRLHYIERGQGTPIVFLHGNGSMIQEVEVSGLVERLSRSHRVIVFDRPGFGYSERPHHTRWTPAAQAELLWKAMRLIGVRQPVLVGHSWGTLIALEMAIRYGADVAATVLIAGYFFPSARADAALASPPAIPVVGDVMRYTVSPLIGRLTAGKLIEKLFAPAPVPSAFSGFPVAMALRPSQIRASAEEAGLMVGAAADLARRYTDLRVPVTIVAGRGDRIVDTSRQSQRLHATVPGSRLDIVEGAGHMVHHTAPGRVAADILEAARSQVAEAAAADP